MLSQMCRFRSLFAALLLLGSSCSCADAYAIVSSRVRSSSAGTYSDTMSCSTLPAYYRSSWSITTTSTTTSFFCSKAKTGSGEMEEDVSTTPEQTPQQLPPLLDSDLIQAAQQPFSWDDIASSTTTSDDSDNDNDNGVTDDISCWQNGQRWWVTREALVKLWILPEDVLGYYDDATTKGENKMLAQVPQLVRFAPEVVIKSAQTVLHDLRLPPALLRKEPLLLVMDAERLRGGFETVRSSIMTSTTSTSTSTGTTALEACRETPGLLVAAATKWTKLDDSSSPVVEKDFLLTKKDLNLEEKQ